MKRLVITLALLVACSSSHDADASGEVVAGSSTSAIARSIAQSGELKAAQDAIDAGHPWRATQLVAPLLRDPQKKTPAAVLVAARAAAGWGGWSVVDKLLVDEQWIDTQSDGEARELLTRAAFDRGADSTSLGYASAALQQSKTKAEREARAVLLARALERNNRFDTAAALYTRASAAFPSIRDWFLLRAAGSESDSARRAADFSGVKMPVAKARVVWTDARALRRRARRGEPLRVAWRDRFGASTQIVGRAGQCASVDDSAGAPILHPHTSRLDRREASRRRVGQGLHESLTDR